jgi:hypothetical protein
VKKKLTTIFIASMCFLGIVSCKSVKKPVEIYSTGFNEEEYVWDEWIVSTNVGDWTFEQWDGRP